MDVELNRNFMAYEAFFLLKNIDREKSKNFTFCGMAALYGNIPSSAQKTRSCASETSIMLEMTLFLTWTKISHYAGP